MIYYEIVSDLSRPEVGEFAIRPTGQDETSGSQSLVIYATKPPPLGTFVGISHSGGDMAAAKSWADYHHEAVTKFTSAKHEAPDDLESAALAVFRQNHQADLGAIFGIDRLREALVARGLDVPEPRR